MDALVRAFASDDDTVVVVADEGDVVDDGEDDAGDDTGSVTVRMLRPTCPIEPILLVLNLHAKSLGMAPNDVSAFGGGAPHVIRLLFYSQSQIKACFSDFSSSSACSPQ